MRLCMLSVLSLTLIAPAFATDGVLEINQTCAVETGCFAGDSAGFPVTITGSAGSSYRLTSDLDLLGAGTIGILISTSYVSVDLGGFRMQCTHFVPPSTVESCGLTNASGGAVRVDSTQVRKGIEVRNGSIVGMGGIGIWLGGSSVVSDVRVFSCANSGIIVGAGSTVSDSIANFNRGSGIAVDAGSSVQRSTTYSNTVTGLYVPQASYRDNTVQGNLSGTVGGAGYDAGGNVCDGSLTCP
jgi:Right handed beta helix region